MCLFFLVFFFLGQKFLMGLPSYEMMCQRIKNLSFNLEFDLKKKNKCCINLVEKYDNLRYKYKLVTYNRLTSLNEIK